MIGLANEYAQYTLTESEYVAQDYMAASTLWGPKEIDFFRMELEDLRSGATPAHFKIPGDAMNPGPPPRSAGIGSLLLSIIHLAPSVPFGPNYVGDERELPDDGLQEILLNRHHQPERHLPYFEWTEAVREDHAEYHAAEHRFIWVEQDGKKVYQADSDFLKSCGTRLTRTRHTNGAGLRFGSAPCG